MYPTKVKPMAGEEGDWIELSFVAQDRVLGRVCKSVGPQSLWAYAHFGNWSSGHAIFGGAGR